MLALIQQVSGTPYITGGDSPAGTDCSGLASWVSNVASGRPAFGSRFNTGNEESALLARGFQYGTAPNALVVGWNGRHTAVTLPDGTPVSSGEHGGVHIGGGGAYQPQFTHHMFLPMPDDGLPPPPMDAPMDAPFAPEPPPLPEPEPAPAQLVAAPMMAEPMIEAPAEEAPVEAAPVAFEPPPAPPEPGPGPQEPEPAPV